LNLRLLFFILAFSANSTLNAQEHKGEMHQHDHHKNEIAAGYSSIYLLDEKEFASGVHVHYTRNISHSGFGLGLGFERIFNHNHTNLGLLFSYRVKENLAIGLSPGINWEEDKVYRFAMHLEAAYEFEIGDFHIGPVADYAIDSEHHHISFGIHLGYGF